MKTLEFTFILFLLLFNPTSLADSVNISYKEIISQIPSRKLRKELIKRANSKAEIGNVVKTFEEWVYSFPESKRKENKFLRIKKIFNKAGQIVRYLGFFNPTYKWRDKEFKYDNNNNLIEIKDFFGLRENRRFTVSYKVKDNSKEMYKFVLHNKRISYSDTISPDSSLRIEISGNEIKLGTTILAGGSNCTLTVTIQNVKSKRKEVLYYSDGNLYVEKKYKNNHLTDSILHQIYCDRIYSYKYDSFWRKISKEYAIKRNDSLEVRETTSFYYDSTGNLYKKEYRPNGDSLINKEEFFEYDTTGNLIKKVTYLHPLTNRRINFTHYVCISGSSKESYISTYLYDSLGRLSQEREYSRRNTLNSEIKNRKVIKRIRYSYPKDTTLVERCIDLGKHREMKCKTFDKKGRLLQQRFLQSEIKGNRKCVGKVSIDTLGKTLENYSYNGKDSTSKGNIYEYNTFGKKTLWKKFINDSLISTEKYLYNEKGDLDTTIIISNGIKKKIISKPTYSSDKKMIIEIQRDSKTASYSYILLNEIGEKIAKLKLDKPGGLRSVVVYEYTY